MSHYSREFAPITDLGLLMPIVNPLYSHLKVFESNLMHLPIDVSVVPMMKPREMTN